MHVTTFDWLPFLRQWNEAILDDLDVREELSKDMVDRGWIGRPGATTEQIQAAEHRLGTMLPGSYTSFLKTSNGWPTLPPFIETMWSTDEIAWFRARHQDWIDVFGLEFDPITDSAYFVYGKDQSSVSLRREYLPSCLEISERYDGAIMLLNPLIVDDRGEWEAWLFANWYPGAARFRSFAEMMEHYWEVYREQRLNP
jgi:cell wall assembly regulator SMI1